MNTKTFIVKILKIISLPLVIFLLGREIIDLFSSEAVQLADVSSSMPSSINWNAISAIGTTGATVAASVAVYYAYKTWVLERLPIVHATGAFIISTRCEKNKTRDQFIFKPDSVHTLQLVNIGRGPAKNIAPSVRKDVKGNFLEDINPHAFSLPANKGTGVFSETLRIHGQIFVIDNDHELEFENSRKTAYFYIHFEDCLGKRYLTKVKINSVEQVDDQNLDKLIKEKRGIEVWKIMENINATNQSNGL